MPKDACYHKVVARYGPKTSAYRSGAMAKCRKVGAANWGNKSKKQKGGLAASVMSDVYGSGRTLRKKMKNGGVSKVKGVSTEGLTSRQATTLKKHSVHHTRKHIQSMVNAMKKGASFSASHKMAQKKVGS